jgi:hypothetical protein
MMNVAKNWEWRDDKPCEGVAKFREERRDRWLWTAEIDRLGDALDQHPNQSAANAIRLILLTGARRGEEPTGLSASLRSRYTFEKWSHRRALMAAR